jgi:hypothetical protein
MQHCVVGWVVPDGSTERMPSSSTVKKREETEDVLIIEEESTVFLRNVGNHLHSDAAPHPIRPKSSIIHSFYSLSYDKSIDSSKARSSQSAICASTFNFQYPYFSWRSSSSFLHLLPRLPVTYIIPSIFTSITCFRRQFLRKMWPMKLVFLLLIVCRVLFCSLTL